jgi:hypothetical protein
LAEYKRLSYHTPIIQTEVLKEHSHQVLHVSFAHNGKMFATCSKDGYVLVKLCIGISLKKKKTSVEETLTFEKEDVCS